MSKNDRILISGYAESIKDKSNNYVSKLILWKKCAMAMYDTQISYILEFKIYSSKDSSTSVEVSGVSFCNENS